MKSNENIGAVDLSEELPAVVATWKIVHWNKIAGSAFRVFQIAIAGTLTRNNTQPVLS